MRLGDIVPADARLLDGDPVEVDQSALTGESLPATRKPGEAVFSGSIVRRGGVQAQPRNLLRPIAQNFIEMADHGSMNWCCGGGGGVSSNERADELKLTAFNRKKSQIEEIEVEAVVTACSKCRMVMEDGIEANEMDMPMLGLTELIAEHLAPKPQ